MARPGRHRLSMDIPIEIWEEIEKIAKNRNITITKLVNKLLFLEAIKDKEYE